MHDIGQAFLTAAALIRSFDPELVGIVALSLRVSLSATVTAMLGNGRDRRANQRDQE